MKILIFSDLHGDIETLNNILDNFEPDVDEIWCAGDLFYPYSNDAKAQEKIKKVINRINYLKKPFYMAKGNCEDFCKIIGFKPEIVENYLVLERDGLKYILTHGDRYVSDYSKLKLAEQEGAGVIFSGHSHVYFIIEENEVVLVNCGSPAYPRNILKIPTVVLLDSEKKRLQIINIKDFSVMDEISISNI